MQVVLKVLPLLQVRLYDLPDVYKRQVHTLNVHLVRRTRETVVLRVIAAEVFNERLFQKLENSLIVLRVYRDFETVHATVSTLDRADLNSSVSRQVTPELPEVLSVVVLEDKNGITDVFLHVVHEVGLQEVDGDVYKRQLLSWTRYGPRL